MEILNYVILFGSFISACGIIIGCLSKILDIKLNGLYDNQRLSYRYQISSFSGDLRNGITKTREEFQAIFEMYDKYEMLVKKLKLTNHYIDNEVKFIESKYLEI